MLSSVSRKGLRTAALATALLAAPFALQPALYSTPVQAHGVPGSFSDLVEEAKPAVVTVVTRTAGASRQAATQELPQLAPDNPLREFFDRFRDEAPQNGERDRPAPQARGLGSGFVVDADGIIVTNNHVIDGASEISVVLEDGTELSASLVGRDPKTDLAVLRVDAGRDLPTVPWGNSDSLRVGDWVVAIGNPFGLGGTVTTGIVSARGRNINAGPYDDFIQVDAAINRGNSGGPLFDTDGEVVGINTAIFSPNGGNVGLGFAVPANQAQAIVAQILETGTVERGFIGVRIQQVTPDIAESLGLSKAEGALVSEVTEGGPADAAGLRQGDVILRFDNRQIEDLRDLTRAVADTRPGTDAALLVWRDGGGRDLTVEIGRLAEEAAVAAAPPQDARPAGAVVLPALGLTLADPSDDLRARFGLERPVDGAIVIAVEPETPAADSGLRAGDVITGIGQARVSSAAETRDAVMRAEQDERKSVLLLVGRDDGPRYIALPLREA